jgi:hypothetical protein
MGRQRLLWCWSIHSGTGKRMLIRFPQRLPMRGMAPGVLLLALLTGIPGGCTPTVKVATDEPITINLNVNIRHEILIKVERELENLFAEESELF